MSTEPARGETAHWGRGVEVLARHASGLVAVAKPAGTLSHPNTGEDIRRAVVTLPYDTGRECFTLPGGAPFLWLLHRLDGPTSGVLLLAENPAIAKAVKAAFAGRGVSKTYRALVFGSPPAGADVWTDRLFTERGGGGPLRTRSFGRNRPAAAAAAPAVTDVRPVASRDTEFGHISQLELCPRTGRTHQLRVQCQRHRLPIIGDQTYGDFKLNRAYARATGSRRLHLHALSVRLALEFEGAPLEFAATAPLPPEFTASFTR